MSNDTGKPSYEDQLVGSQRDTTIQIGLSLLLGISAFFAFCFLRPKWSGLYAARKRQREGEAAILPELPDTWFGWIPAVWRITEQQVLASAGLDAYVFLRFFKVAIKFLSVTLFFALVVLKPVHDAFPDKDSLLRRNHTSNLTAPKDHDIYGPIHLYKNHTKDDQPIYDALPTSYLWMYLVFAYVFTALAMYLIATETERIIAIRQEYLGSRSTVTDRTIRLSGIPTHLRSEDELKRFIERLQIGKVDSVTLCRNWQKLDDHMAQRMELLRKLEEAWTVYLGRRRVERNLESLPITQPPPPGPDVEPDDEHENDQEDGTLMNGNADAVPYSRDRPTTTLRYGFMKMQSRKIDAIDYYEEKLRRLDDEIRDLRKQEFPPTALAFITMDSVASCQMAAQAVLDSSPMQMIANQSPAPGDIIWSNTYMSRSTRMIRAWSVTVIIAFLTIFWSLVLVPLATALNLETIHRVWPQLAETLESHYVARSLVKTQLPTLLSSLLFVLVPYLYDLLASYQGMSSQGEVELSVISKNFFFVFFNYFIIFTVLGTFSNFLNFFEKFQDTFKDTTRVAYTLARSLQLLESFYTNLVILQGLGLFPFRLLEIGSVLLYPIYRMGAKTPRDYAELVQPPIFYYGFYLPQIMLIFIITLVYSILRDSWKILLAGLIYFLLGGFVYKYQLLYAMDHKQNSTGKAWLMICHRVMVGLLLFQLTTAGQLALKGAFTRSVLVVPLLVGTVWFSWGFDRSYRPLMRFISLASIERALPLQIDRDDMGMDMAVDPDLDAGVWAQDAREGGNEWAAEGEAPANGWAEETNIRYTSETRPGHTVDESRETGIRYINPNLISPLEPVWIADKGIEERDQTYANGGDHGGGSGRRRRRGTRGTFADAVNAAV